MKLAQFSLFDPAMCYQEENVPDISDPLWRMYNTTGNILAIDKAYCIATMLRRASSNELVLRIVLYKSPFSGDLRALQGLTYGAPCAQVDFTFTCDARAIGRLWRTLPLWRWALPYSLVLSLAGVLPARPEGNTVAVRQAWSDYFSGFERPFKGLELTGLYVESL